MPPRTAGIHLCADQATYCAVFPKNLLQLRLITRRRQTTDENLALAVFRALTTLTHTQLDTDRHPNTDYKQRCVD